jgi:HK97 family phage portal protein
MQAPTSRGQNYTTKSHTGPYFAFDRLGAPTWTPRDPAAFAREGFMQNAIVYRAVRMIAEAAASVPLLLYAGDEEIAEHPLLALLARPNATSSTPDLLEAWYGFLLVAGNAYLEAVPLGGDIRELHTLRPDRMRILAGPGGWPEAYDYTVDGKTRRIAGEAAPGVPRILHLKLFHPLNDHYGFSPIEAAASAIDIHNTASRWNKALLDNSARPSGALVYTARDGNLTTEQYDRLKSELEHGFQGAARAGRPLLLEGGLDWKSMSLSPKDMDFIEAKHVAAREIALALGVPPMLLGIPGDNTYANYQEANRTFWRQTVLPLVNRTAKALSAWLAPAYSGVRPSGSDTISPPGIGSSDTPLTLRPDLDAIEALSTEREALWTRLDKATFLTPNEKRSAVGYGPLHGGDAIKGSDPAGLTPFDNPAQKFNPYHDELGRFTTAEGVTQGGGLVHLAQDRRGFRVDLSEHEGPVGDSQLEGHTIRDHVGRTTASMIAQMGRDMWSDNRGGIVYRQLLGTFPSVTAAQRVIGATLSAHTETVDRVIVGDFGTRGVALGLAFDSPTGEEAYRSSPTAQVEFRRTSLAVVVIRKDPQMSGGFRIITAFPASAPPRRARMIWR